MSKIIRYIANHPHYAKIKHWGKLIGITATAQAIIQLVGFISGILVIRLLPVEEYAYYTIANTMLGTMTVLSDGGISAGVMAQGGKVWQDRGKLGTVLATGLHLRCKFALGALIVSIPILCYLLLHQGASWITCLLITVSLIPAFYAALSDNLLQIIPKLHQDITPLQKNQLNVSIGRLLLTGLTLFAFPWTFVAVLASGIPRILGNIKLRKITNKFVDEKGNIDKEVQKNILKGVKRLMPDAIYYCLSGQITIFLISFFGKAEAIAQVGALGRFSIALGLITTLYTILIVPRFAKQKTDIIILGKKFTLILSSTLIISILIILLTYLFSDFLLKILGDNYLGLNKELILTIISGCLSMITGILFGLTTSRGWPTHPAVIIIGSLSFILLGIFLFDIATLKGVLYFNIFINIFPILAHSLNFIYKLKTEKV